LVAIQFGILSGFVGTAHMNGDKGSARQMRADGRRRMPPRYLGAAADIFPSGMVNFLQRFAVQGWCVGIQGMT
jgi:hypothetical protein